MVRKLNQRSREILRHVVDAYVETGSPIGSHALAKRLKVTLSSATVRHVMADLEEAGLLFAPHISAGRMPTDAGLRLFVDGLLELGNLDGDERRSIDSQCAASGASFEGLLKEATGALSGLSRCAGIVMAPKTESTLKHMEFVSLGPGRTLVVIVTENGIVENRIIETPHNLPPSALIEASNYLNLRLAGRTMDDASGEIMAELKEHRAQLDELTAKVVESGLATWAGGDNNGSLIVRGQANLLDNVTAASDLEKIRALFQALETREMALRVLSLADSAEGVHIFIGADNQLFDLAGCSMIVGPYHDGQKHILGAIGVIGPTRMNYARIIPMVDYTAKVIGKYLGQS